MKIDIPQSKTVGLLIGGYGTGKTISGLEWIKSFAQTNQNSRCLVVRGSWHSMRNSTYQRWTEKMATAPIEEPRSGISFGFGNSLVYFDSFVSINGTSRRDCFLSHRPDAIFVDESIELSQDNFDLLCSRLNPYRDWKSQILLACNANIPEYLIGQINAGQVHLIASNQEDNPMLFDQQKRELTSAGKSYRENLSGGGFWKRLPNNSAVGV